MSLYSEKVMSFYDGRLDYYRNFLRRTNQKQRAVEKISEILGEKEFHKILLIGCGSGSTEMEIVDNLADEDPKIYCVDPSQEMKKRFLNNAEESGLRKNIVDFQTKTFESGKYSPPKTDLMVLIDSIYFIEGWRDSESEIRPLVKMYDALEPGGRAAMTIKREDSPHREVKSVAGGGNTTSRKLISALEREGIPYLSKPFKAEMDMSDCFDTGCFLPNGEGRMLLDFMFKGRWGEFSDEKKGEILDEIKKQSVRKDGKILLPKKYDCIYIKKDSSGGVEV